MIQSFDEANLVHAIAVDPTLPVAFLVEDREAMERGMAHGWKNIFLRHDLLDVQVAAELHRRGICVGAWTPNSSQDLLRVIELGADVVITDDPVRAKLHSP